MSSAHTEQTARQSYSLLCAPVLPDDKSLLKWRHSTFHLQEVFLLLMPVVIIGAGLLSLIGTSSQFIIRLSNWPGTQSIANLNEALCAVTDRVMMSVRRVTDVHNTEYCMYIRHRTVQHPTSGHARGEGRLETVLSCRFPTCLCN